MPDNTTYYNSIQEAIDAGTSNMTVLRENLKNDDNTTPYNIDNSWINFKFNGTSVNTIYSNGNSWLGFGSTNMQFYVNQRDTAVWWEWIEYGTIDELNFIKFRWRGYAHYSTTASDAWLEWEIFIFDNHQILFNYVRVPTSSFTNTNAINGTSFSTQAGTPCEYTFTPETEEGYTWTVGTERPNVHPSPGPGPSPYPTATYRGPYNSKTLYYKNDIVVFGNIYYQALSNVPMGILPTDDSFWKRLSQETYMELFANGGSNVFDIVNGPTGSGGESRSIDSVIIDEDHHLIIRYTDGTTEDAGLLPGTDITPNETGTANANLTSLLIGDQLYNVAKVPSTRPVTLTVNGWSNNTQTVQYPGIPSIASRYVLIPTPDEASMEEYYNCQIMLTHVTSVVGSIPSITFTCKTVPSSVLNLYVAMILTY